MKKPLVSIVMPLYNAGSYVEEAVKSILQQTFSDFELIVVNDGSTDNSLQIVQSFNDSRIRILQNETNKGIVFTRNRGMEAAEGSFIAPFDADDLARKDKFEKQITFLLKNPEFGMIGSWARIIDEQGKLTGKKWKVAAPPTRIPAILLFRNYFVQSSVVMRREVIPAGGYRQGFDIIEDYRMWIDIARRCKVWNYPDYLVYYRQHNQGVTTRNSDNEDERDLKLISIIADQIGLDRNETNVSALLSLKNASLLPLMEDLRYMEAVLLEILEKNSRTGLYDKKELTKVVYNRWLKACNKARLHHFKMMKTFITSPLQRHFILASLLPSGL